MVLAVIVMIVLSLLLSWLPLFGPLIAGIVGGYCAGGIGRGLAAAVIPLVLLGVFVWWVGAALNHAVAGFFVSVGVTLLLVVHEVGLFIGAVIGGAIAQGRKPAAPRTSA